MINDEFLISNANKQKEHESLSREYVELKKILNKEDCSKTEEWVRIYCLNKANNKSSRGEKYKLSDKLYREIQEYYFSMNVRISEKKTLRYSKENSATCPQPFHPIQCRNFEPRLAWSTHTVPK